MNTNWGGALLNPVDSQQRQQPLSICPALSPSSTHLSTRETAGTNTAVPTLVAWVLGDAAN